MKPLRPALAEDALTEDFSESTVRSFFPSGRKQRGAAAIFVALTMIISMFFVALGVDVAMLYNLRRQAQNGVDSAALAAIQDPYDDAAIKTAVYDTLQGSELIDITLPDLNTCAAEAVPADFTKIVGANCISHDSLRQRIRVRVPDQEADTAFAQVFGVTELKYTAVSLVGVLPRGNSDVLPFWVPFSAGTGHRCLKSGSSSVNDPLCDGPLSGNFGFANFGIWGNPLQGTTLECTGSGSNRMPQNTAMGLDHDLSLFGVAPHNATEVVDNISCGATLQPNAAETLTGNMNNKAGEAFFSANYDFPDGERSRLARVSDLSWGQTASVAGFTLDDNPLWEFIGNIASSNVPDSCQKNQFVLGGAVGATANLPAAVATYVTSGSIENQMVKLLERCMKHYEGNSWDDYGGFSPAEAPVGCTGACSDPVFNSNTATDSGPDLFDIQYSPRFGYVPRIHIDSPSGSTVIRFIDLEPIYLQRLYGGNCGGTGCQIQFDPGVGYSAGGNATKAPAISAFMMPGGMLPNGLGDSGAAYGISQNRFVSVME